MTDKRKMLLQALANARRSRAELYYENSYKKITEIHQGQDKIYDIQKAYGAAYKAKVDAHKMQDDTYNLLIQYDLLHSEETHYALSNYNANDD